MKHKWTSQSLEELCEFKNGLWKGKKGPFVEAGVIRNTNFTKNGELDDSNIAYLDVEEKQLASRRLKFGDLILEKSGGGPKQPVGRVICFEKTTGVFSFSNFTSIIRIKDSSRIDFRFLHRFLHFLYLTGATEPMQKSSTNIRNLQLREYKQIEVPFPPLEEQKRIVAILDEAFAGIETAIANTETNIASATELFESFSKSLFRCRDWPSRKLSDVTENLDRQRVPITKNKREPGEIPYYGASGVVDHVADHLFDEDLLLVSEDGANLLARTYPIAFSISGKSWVNNHAHVLRFKEIYSQKFVEFFLNSISLEPYVSGMAQPKLNQKSLNSIEVPWPELEIRKATLSQLEELSESCKALKQSGARKLECLTELKQTLLQKAFSGELTADAAMRDAKTVTA